MAEKSSWDQVNIQQKHDLVRRHTVERKLAKLSKTTFLTVLPLNYFMGAGEDVGAN